MTSSRLAGSALPLHVPNDQRGRLSDKSAASARSTRCKEALAVSRALNDLAARGILDRLVVGKLRVGLMPFRISCRSACTYQLVLDLDANALLLPRLLSGVAGNPSLPRSVQAWLHSPAADASSPQSSDSSKRELRLFVQRGALTVLMPVLNGEYECGARYLVSIAHRILERFAPQVRCRVD